ncbi:MAG: hypothetical protein ABSD67_08145 [Terracidiphilus sp.]|jgi:hypothetical protein
MPISRRNLLAALVLSTSFFRPCYSIEGPTLIWHDLERHYNSFDAIKPSLANNADTPVYLSTLGIDGAAQLTRFNEKTGIPELGHWKQTEPVAGHPIRSIEIPAHSTRAIDVNWRVSTEGDPPTAFIVDKTLQKRPIEGKYRLFLRYSPKPWTPDFHHESGYATISATFTVGQ